MTREELKNEYLQHLTDYINNFDYSDIDVFVIDSELSQEEEKYILSLNLKVIEEDD